MAKRRAFGDLRGIQSVELGCRVLGALVCAGGAMGLTELAKASGMSPSKARRYLISFTRAGLIEQDPATGFYDLGGFALQLGLAAQARSDIVRLSRPVLTALRETLGETVSLVVWVGNRPTVLHIEEGNHAIIRLVAPVGGALQLLTTAGGLIFAAYRDDPIVSALIAEELREIAKAPPGVKAPRNEAEAERLFADVRRRGLARVHPIVSTSICTLAAPIFDAQGTATAALVAIGYKTDFDARWDGTVATAVKETAAQLSRRLGHDGAAPNPIEAKNARNGRGKS